MDVILCYYINAKLCYYINRNSITVLVSFLLYFIICISADTLRDRIYNFVMMFLFTTTAFIYEMTFCIIKSFICNKEFVD